MRFFKTPEKKEETDKPNLIILLRGSQCNGSLNSSKYFKVFSHNPNLALILKKINIYFIKTIFYG